MHLTARNRRWAKFAYEFAHELCHVMSSYEENVGADTTKYNQWFEEALCEAASLFTLKCMADTWEASSPPPPDWAAHASALRRYADRLIEEGHRKLPARTALAAWLRQNEDQMRNDPYLREKNEVVANLLLPLFERNPENWGALRYLNLDPEDARSSLRQYLENWYGTHVRTQDIYRERARAHGLPRRGEVHEDEACPVEHARITEFPCTQAGPTGTGQRAEQ